MTIDREHCRTAAAELNEANDCVVRALAIAGQIDYKAMHEYLAHYGREARSGMWPSEYLPAFASLGFTLTKLEGPSYKLSTHLVDGHERYVRGRGWVWVSPSYRARRKKVAPGVDYDAATVTTLARELDRGTYLVSTDGHVLCLRDGEVHDHTKGRRHQVLGVYRVTEGE